MSDNLSNENFVEEEGRSNRPFALAVGALVIILLLAIACTAIFALQNRNPQEATRVAILATNEAVATQNFFVTQTISARETIAAMPTNTPVPTNTPLPPTKTPTPAPTNTPLPTETPVVVTEVLETLTPDFSGGNSGGNSGNTGGTGGTGWAGSGTLATPTLIATGPSGSGTLPTTGIGVWGVLGLAILAFFILVLARRLRTSFN